MDAVTAAILVFAVLLAIGIIANQLFRLRDWLNRTSDGSAPHDDGAPDNPDSNSA